MLAMNVAGLPEIINDNGVPGDKATNAATMGAKFAEYGYDVIQLQEVGRPVYPGRDGESFFKSGGGGGQPRLIDDV